MNKLRFNRQTSRKNIVHGVCESDVMLLMTRFAVSPKKNTKMCNAGRPHTLSSALNAAGGKVSQKNLQSRFNCAARASLIVARTSEEIMGINHDNYKKKSSAVHCLRATPNWPETHRKKNHGQLMSLRPDFTLNRRLWVMPNRLLQLSSVSDVDNES